MTMPDFYTDRLMPLLTGEELRVLLYLARTLGEEAGRVGAKPLAAGAGLNDKTARRALDTLKEYGIVVRTAENDPHQNAGCEYRLQGEEASLAWEALAGRRAEWDSGRAGRTIAARAEKVRREGERVAAHPAAAGVRPLVVRQPHPTPQPVWLSDNQTPVVVAQPDPPQAMIRTRAGSEVSPSGMSPESGTREASRRGCTYDSREEVEDRGVQGGKEEEETQKGNGATCESEDAALEVEAEQILAGYPRRNGGQAKGLARKRLVALLRAGHHANRLRMAVEQYAAWATAEGKVGTQYVMQAASFFGPERAGWLDDWEAPLPPVSAFDELGNTCAYPGLRREVARLVEGWELMNGNKGNG